MIAPVVRDSVAAANERDLSKYLDAAKVGTMTEGSLADRDKQSLRRGQTRERGTRKAKIEAKLERSRTMADKDLRQEPPEVGRKTKPIPTMRRNRWTAGAATSRGSSDRLRRGQK